MITGPRAVPQLIELHASRVRLFDHVASNSKPLHGIGRHSPETASSVAKKYPSSHEHDVPSNDPSDPVQIECSLHTVVQSVGSPDPLPPSTVLQVVRLCNTCDRWQTMWLAQLVQMRCSEQPSMGCSRSVCRMSTCMIGNTNSQGRERNKRRDSPRLDQRNHVRR